MVNSAPHSPRRRHALFTTTPRCDGSLALEGDLDLATVPQLARALRTAPQGDLTIDMSGLTFCGCAGLAELVADRQRRATTGDRLILINVTAAMHRLLTLTGLAAEFTIDPDAGADHSRTDAGVAPVPDGTRLQCSRADRSTMEKAVAILMAAHDVGADQALHLLAGRARQANCTLQSAAATLVRQQHAESKQSTMTTATPR